MRQYKHIQTVECQALASPVTGMAASSDRMHRNSPTTTVMTREAVLVIHQAHE